MSAQHTPGPWFVAAQNDGLVIIDGPPSPAPYDGPIPKSHGPVVVATPNWRLAEHEANARIMATAPELLDSAIDAEDAIVELHTALHDVLHIIDYMRCSDGTMTLSGPSKLARANELLRAGRLDGLRAAIAKARGAA